MTFSFISFSLFMSAETLVIGPSISKIEFHPSNTDIAVDTLRILPRGDRSLEIGEYAFWNSPTLSVVEFPEDCRLKLGEGAFRGCSGIEELSLPDETSLDGQYIFSGCRSLKRIKLPSRLETLPPQTFSYCAALEEIELPESLRRIGNNAFSECRSLRRVYIPNQVTELESYALSECISLKEARLPANGALLGELIFSGCRSLSRIIEPSLSVPAFDCESYIFEPDETGLYSKCEIIVPLKAVDLYRKAHGWKLFRRITPLPERSGR